jgi:chromosome segregation ATPase
MEQELLAKQDAFNQQLEELRVSEEEYRAKNEQRLKEDHNKEISSLREEHQRALADLQSRHATELEQKNQEIATLQAQLSARDAEISQLKHQQELMINRVRTLSEAQQKLKKELNDKNKEIATLTEKLRVSESLYQGALKMVQEQDGTILDLQADVKSLKEASAKDNTRIKELDKMVKNLQQELRTLKDCVQKVESQGAYMFGGGVNAEVVDFFVNALNDCRGAVVVK